ncbi:MAG: SDR family oxidoreductase [Bacteroidales bacterium]|nr:SDR family oxidoreductase [Bacteroidales bacterium]MCF8326985.1 SDR family oxidoreductase [Bacteroidales bacterium]
MNEPEKQTALVTGASGGIGKEFARLLAIKGYNLILVARSKDKLLELQKTWREEFQIEVHIFPTDLANKKQVDQLFDRINFERLKIDILINNAGFGDYGEFVNADAKKEDAMIRVNVNALTTLSRNMAREMVKQNHGYILNVSSVAAFQPGPLMAVYAASKAYVLSYTQAVANELKGTGVSATVLCPGPVDTDFVKNASLESSRLFKIMKPVSARYVANYGLKAMFKRKVVAVPGFKEKLMAGTVRFLPSKFVTRVTRKIQERV